jgi:hypothetical protein
VGGILIEKTVGFFRFFLNLGRKPTVAVPKSEDGFGCSEFFGVQRSRFTCSIVLKSLIGLSRKSWPGPGVSNDFVPAPIILVKEYDLYIDGSGFWRRLRQFYLSVFILTFEDLHQE